MTILLLSAKFGDIIDLTANIDKLTVSHSQTADIEECHTIITRTSNQILVLTQNIRSINCNMPGFEILLSRLKLECDILILTECWLNCTSTIPKLDGYCHVATKTNKKQNDGVVIYYKDKLNIRIDEPDFQDCNCLIAIIDEEIAIISLYRSPSYTNIDNFLSSLDKTFQLVSIYKHNVLMGDINIGINTKKNRHTW